MQRVFVATKQVCRPNPNSTALLLENADAYNIK